MTIFNRVGGFILNILLVRFFSADNFGLFALFQRVSEQVNSILRVGGLESSTHVLVARYQDKPKQNFTSLISVVMVFRFITCALLAIIFSIDAEYFVSEVLKQPALLPYKYLLLITAMAGSLEVLSEGILKGLGRFQALSNINIIFSIISVFLISSLAYFFGVTGSIIALATCLSLRSVFVIFCGILFSQKSGFNFSLDNFLGVLIKNFQIGLPNYLPVLITAPANIYAISLLTSVAGIDDIAYYRVIITCGVLIQVIPYSFLPVLISSTASKIGEDESADFMLENIKYMVSISSIIGLSFFGIMPLFISIAFGNEYALAVKFFEIYLFTMIVVNCLNILVSFFLARQLAKFNLLINSFAGIILFASASYLIPLSGLPGFLIAEFIGYFSALFLAIYIYYKKINNGKKIFSLVISFLPFGIIFCASILAVDSLDRVILRFFTSISCAVLLASIFWRSMLLNEDRTKFRNYLLNTNFIKRILKK